VKSGDTLDLGDGRVLAFEEIPNVHWPETMATFDTKSGTLFPCDAFGAFGAITDSPYDDQLSPEEIDFFEEEATRYYANIVGAYSAPAKKAVIKTEKLPVKIIAPGHGIVWRQNPQKIIDDYKRYAAYSKGPAKEEVTVIWGSMYGNTEMGVEPVVEGLKAGGVKVNVHRVRRRTTRTCCGTYGTPVASFSECRPTSTRSSPRCRSSSTSSAQESLQPKGVPIRELRLVRRRPERAR
jgi:anaerobic nitric oxide reductase flavorubredoxin